MEVVIGNGRTITNLKSGERVWLDLDSPLTLTGAPGKVCLMEEAWRAPRYILAAHGESLENLIKRAVVLYHVPASFETTPAAIAHILSGENRSWRVYAVDFPKDAGRIYFKLVLKAGKYGCERYQTTEIGLGLLHVLGAAIKITREADGGSEQEIVYKRALGPEEKERRIVLAGWDSTIGLEVLRICLNNEEDCPTESSSRITLYTPPEGYDGIEIDKL